MYYAAPIISGVLAMVSASFANTTLINEWFPFSYYIICTTGIIIGLLFILLIQKILNFTVQNNIKNKVLFQGVIPHIRQKPEDNKKYIGLLINIINWSTYSLPCTFDEERTKFGLNGNGQANPNFPELKLVPYGHLNSIRTDYICLEKIKNDETFKLNVKIVLVCNTQKNNRKKQFEVEYCKEIKCKIINSDKNEPRLIILSDT